MANGEVEDCADAAFLSAVKDISVKISGAILWVVAKRRPQGLLWNKELFNIAEACRHLSGRDLAVFPVHSFIESMVGV